MKIRSTHWLVLFFSLVMTSKPAGEGGYAPDQGDHDFRIRE